MLAVFQATATTQQAYCTTVCFLLYIYGRAVTKYDWNKSRNETENMPRAILPSSLQLNVDRRRQQSTCAGPRLGPQFVTTPVCVRSCRTTNSKSAKRKRLQPRRRTINTPIIRIRSVRRRTAPQWCALAPLLLPINTGIVAKKGTKVCRKL